jgi:prolyl oligopeptidase
VTHGASDARFDAIAYPASRRDPTFDVLHGVRVDDPYRWLEDPDSADTIAWTGAQNALTRTLLDGPLRDRLRRELHTLYDYPRTSAPVPRGDRFFFTRNSGLQNQPVLYVQDGSSGAPRVLLDPNALSEDGTTALTAWEPSPDGRLIAYAISHEGSDWQELRVRDVAAARDLPDVLRWVKFVTIAWHAGGRAFYYTRFPEDGNYFPSVHAHTVGTPQAQDRVVYPAADEAEIVYEVDRSSDCRFLAVTAFRGASENSRVVVLDTRADGDAALAPPARVPVFDVGEGFTDSWRFVDAAGDTLIFRTNRGAPRGRIVACSPGSAPRDVVPESADTLIDAAFVAGRIVAVYLHDASSRVRIYDIAGGSAGDVRLPTLGSVTEMTGEAGGAEAFFRFASFTWPPTILRYSLADGGTSEFFPGPARVRPARYDVSQVWYPSRDGTRVSMFLVRLRQLPAAAPHPVWLTAYGGFNINIVPDFDPAHFVWLDRGGILAVPNLRGGGEYGEAWHQAGTLGRKQNVFDDCIAAIEHLVREGLTRPGLVVLEGGSNGGLLVAAVLTQRPDLPAAVICRVPVADMLRYHLFTVGRFWIPEYGCADDAAQFGFLHAYSPLHRVRDEARYPPVLITTAETDDRVDPGMARKLAARLQAACSTSRSGPACIRIEPRAGHGAGKPVSKMIEEDADIYTFALKALLEAGAPLPEARDAGGRGVR